MKFKNQIVGLPVLSIIEVAYLGSVQNLVINPDSGSVEYLVIEPEQWYLERLVIPFKDVAAIGQDAVTIETKAHAVLITSVPNAIELLNNSIAVIGARVMTRKGRISGSVDEIAIDGETGKISACRWIAEDKTGLIPVNFVITFGKDMLVVEDNFETELLENISQLENHAPDNLKDDAPASATEVDPLKYFDDKQKQYLVGRTITTDILTDQGDIIAEQGEKVTQKIVDKAVAADKFVELTTNTRE